MLSDARFTFALEILKKYTLMDPKTSFFLNPQLIYQNLLVYFFIENKPFVEASLRQVLRIPDDISKAVIQQYYALNGKQEFCHTILRSSDKDAYMCITNHTFWSPYPTNRIVGDEESKSFSLCGYLKSIDFRTKPNKRKFINNYTNNVTRRNYKEALDLLPPDNNLQTYIVMVNAVHIKGQLAHFKNNPGSKDADVIPISTTNHGKSDQLYAYIMEEPYKENNLSIFFFFPLCHLEYGKENFFDTTENGIIQLIERLTTEEGSRELRKLLNEGMPRQPDDIEIPSFKIKQNLRMHDLLLKMGMKKFISLGKNLPSYPRGAVMIDSSIKSKQLGIVSDAIHQVSIDIMGKDAIADANNAILSHTVLPEVEEPNVIVNGRLPCVCMIYDKIFCNILFSGVLIKNNKESKVTSVINDKLLKCNDGDKA